jgi:spore coat protein CotH
MSARFTAVAGAFSLLLSACGGSGSGDSTTAADAATGGTPATGGAGGGNTGGQPTGGSVATPDAAPTPTPDAQGSGGASVPPDAGSLGGSGGGPAPDAAAPVGGQGGGGSAPPADAGIGPDQGPPPPPQDDAHLRINEFMASNHFTIDDDLGRASDWIELHNAGPVAVNLDGYRITNGFDERARVSVLGGGLSIAPGGYLLLWADGRSQLSNTHLRFNLTRDAGSIGLARPDGSWIDRVDYGTQTPDISAARTPDGSNQWQTLWEVSPGAANPEGRGRPSPDEPRMRPDSAPSFDQAVDRLFNGLPEFRIAMAPEHVQALRDDPRAYVPAMFTYQGRTIGPVGVRIKGQNSFLPIDQKPSLKISVGFDDGDAEFHGLKIVTLNNMRSDVSMVKEVLGYYMARTVGLFASRAGHALVYLNDEFYGVYTNLENIDSLFLSRWFADTSGPLYEGFDVDFRPEMVNRACVDSEDPNRPGCFELESGTDDRTSLIGLANALQQPAALAIPQAEQFVSFDQFHLYWAVCANIGQFDSFPYSNPGDDYHLYVDPETQQITLIPWGMDETFLPGRNVAQVTSVLAQRCLEDPLCHDGWAQQVWLVNDTMNAIDLAAELDLRAALIAPYVAMDMHKPYTTDQVTAEQARVRNFIVNRGLDLERNVPRP